jgi:ribosomal protein S18 acetylase RimI-like enzyme
VQPRIRPYQAADRPAVIDLFLRTSRQLKSNDPEVPIPKDFSHHFLPKLISKVQKGNGFLQIAELDGKVVGFILVVKGRTGPGVKTRTGTGFVNELHVSPRHQGIGIGKRLLASAESECRKRGYDWVSLGVFPLNRGARAFYAKMGYEERFVFLGKTLR